MTLAQDFSGGYQAGVDISNAQSQSDSQTSLLSSQAEMAKMRVGAAKQEQALELAKKASLTTEQAKHAEWDMSQTQDQIKVLNSAIQGAKDNPELQAKLINARDIASKDLIDSQLNHIKFKEAQRQLSYETASAGLLNPRSSVDELRTMAKDTNNPVLAKLADVYEDKAPIKMFADKDNPNGKMMSQLSPDEVEKFRAEMARNMGPQKSEKTASDYYNEQLRIAEIERKRQADLERAAAERTKDALNRDKLDTDKKKTGADHSEKTKVAEAKLDSALAKEINLINEKQNKLLSDSGVSDVNEKGSHWWGSEFSKLPLAKQAQYKRYETQKELIRQQNETAKRDLHDGSYVPPKEIVASSEDKVIGKTPDGRDVYQSKDGKKYTK